MMASRTSHTVDENMENASPTKHKAVSAANRPVTDASKRRVLRDLTPNTPAASRRTNEGGGKKSMSLSPLKRGRGDVLNQERGFTYLKRRRLSQDQQQATQAPLFTRDRQRHDRVPTQQSPPRSRPLSPPSSGRHGASSGAPVAQDKLTADDPQQPEKESDEDSGRESQKSNNTRASFSSLINYDPLSQQALASQALNFVAPSVAAHTTHTPARYSHFLSSTVRAHAQVLRLRLRVAMYKIRTNQINVPFSRLRVPKSPSPTPVPRARHAHPTAPPSRRPLPTPARAARTTGIPDSDLPYGPGPTNAPDTTPNVFSNRYMPMQRAPSSSPPLIHIPPSSLPRYPMAGVGGGGGGGGGGGDDTPLMGRVFPDHDSLDSEATELAEDMHDGHEHAESPSKTRRPLFAAGLSR